MAFGCGGTVDKYTLQSAIFNEAVDPLEVRLPAGIRISDARFGSDQLVSYQPKNGVLPTDAEVRNLLGERQERDKASDEAQSDKNVKGQVAQPVALRFTSAIGLVFIMLGCMMWVRSNKNGNA